MHMPELLLPRALPHCSSEISFLLIFNSCVCICVRACVCVCVRACVCVCSIAPSSGSKACMDCQLGTYSVGPLACQTQSASDLGSVFVLFNSHAYLRTAKECIRIIFIIYYLLYDTINPPRHACSHSPSGDHGRVRVYFVCDWAVSLSTIHTHTHASRETLNVAHTRVCYISHLKPGISSMLKRQSARLANIFVLFLCLFLNFISHFIAAFWQWRG